jgi:hypothetical protein
MSQRLFLPPIIDSSSSRSHHRQAHHWRRQPQQQRPTLVLLLDEIDFLLTKKQSVLYNLLHWPTAASARLLVIGISNTLDFADRCEYATVFENAEFEWFGRMWRCGFMEDHTFVCSLVSARVDFFALFVCSFGL